MKKALLFAVVFAVVPVFGMDLASAAPLVHKTGQSAKKVDEYWTAQRMRDAVPAGRESGPVTKAKPSRGGGPAPGASTEVPLPYPSAHGKVFFTDGGTNYVCSGTALTSSNESTVWTAGHCVNEGPGGFYTNFMFVPAYRDGTAPYGRFAASALLTTSGWQSSGEFGVDVGAAIVDVNSSGQTLSDAVAERAPVFNSARNQSYKLYGYPAAKKFSGQRMRVCDTTLAYTDTSATPDTMGVPCDMTGGSSGGGFVTSSGSVASVVSYSYSNLRNVLFGPHQETEAQQLYQSAQSS